jgi:hypothetical protein
MLKLKDALRRFAWLLWIVVLVMGIAALAYGIHTNAKAAYTRTEQPNPIIILGNEDTILDNLEFILSKEMSSYKDGDWMWAIIDFNSSCQYMSLYFGLPYQIDNVIFTNYTDFAFFYKQWSYNVTKNNSEIYLSYNSSKSDNRVRIQFDWKIKEQIAYDQERVAIGFSSPYYGKPLFEYPLRVSATAGSAWIPEIKNLIIQVEGNNPIDLSLTQPSPSYYYYLDGKTMVFWEFNQQNKASSIQVVFKNPTLSGQKSNLIFNAGLLVGIGLSAIFLVIGKTIDALTEKTKT